MRILLGAIASCAFASSAFAIDYAGYASVDVAHATLSAAKDTVDFQFSAGARLLFDSPFEIDGGLSASNALIQSGDGLLFAANIYAGATLFRDMDVSPNIALGVSGNFYRAGCERTYGGELGTYSCRERSDGYAGVGYRVGFKVRRNESSRITFFFSQMFGENGFRISQLSVGVEFE